MSDVRHGLVIPLDVLEADLWINRHGHTAREKRPEKRQDEFVPIGNDQGEPVAFAEPPRDQLGTPPLGFERDFVERTEPLAAVGAHEDEATGAVVRYSADGEYKIFKPDPDAPHQSMKIDQGRYMACANG